MIAIAEEHSLNVFQAFRLLHRLIRVLGVYQVEVAFQTAPIPSSVTKSLSHIRASVGRIAVFASSEATADRHAMDYLGRAVRRVVRELPTVQQEALGIQFETNKTAEGEFSTDNIPEFVHRWFAFASTMRLSIASEIERQVVKTHSETALEHESWSGPLFFKGEEVTPIVRLIGGTLPELYETFCKLRLTRSRYTVAPANDPAKEGLQETLGVRFVLSCLSVMQVGPYSLETISRYRSKFLAALPAG